jgi:hypothetical protein
MNHATRMIVSTLGIMLGFSGMNHGFFESLQGNSATNGMIIQAIGPAQRMWVHGTEEAFTIIPNFLLTGILALIIGFMVVVWSVEFVHKKNGPTIFILLFILLFLAGGGIGQIVFFIPTWLVATQINQPLTWWRKVLPENVRPGLAKLWPVSLTGAVIFFLFALEIAIFGIVPGLDSDHSELILYICWSFLLLDLLLVLPLTFISGFARDIQARKLD